MEGIWEYVLFLLSLPPHLPSPYCCFPVTCVCAFQRLERLLGILFARFANPESFPPFLRKSCYLNKTPDLVAIKLFPAP